MSIVVMSQEYSQHISGRSAPTRLSLSTMATDNKTMTPDAALRRRAEETGEGLRTAVEALLAELAGRGMRDQRSIQSALDLSQSAISRLVSSVRSGDSLATLASIPGPEALRQ